MARKGFKMLASTKIAIVGALVLGGGYFGWNAYAAYEVDRIQFTELSPGKVSLVGIDAGRGFKIIVSNEVAQLIQYDADKDEFEGATGEEADSTDKRRVPIKDMLSAMQGNVESLGKFVTMMNDPLRKIDLPPTEILWDEADIQKALDGDPRLRAKLESDLNMRLDGFPLDKIRRSSLLNSIVVLTHVPIEVPIAGKVQTLKAPIKLPFVPRFVTAVTEHFKEQFNPTEATILGFYLEEANRLKERKGDVENLAERLGVLIDPERNRREFADAPSRVLSRARVIVNDQQIQNAEVRIVDGPEGKKIANIELDLNDEGRRRLWQYSRRNLGSQLLFVGLDGIAIAAPRIRQELAEGHQTIRGVQNPGLAEEVVNAIKELKQQKT